MQTASPSWLTVPTGIDTGLQRLVEERVRDKVASGEYTADDIYYVANVELGLCKGELLLPDKQLERLRRLCQLWDVDLRAAEITSHRKIIGPIVVAVKKLLHPILRAFFKETLKQQRDFNAAVIAYLADLSNERGEDK